LSGLPLLKRGKSGKDRGKGGNDHGKNGKVGGKSGKGGKGGKPSSRLSKRRAAGWDGRRDGGRHDGGYAVVKVQMPAGIRTYVLIEKCTIGAGMAQGPWYSR